MIVNKIISFVLVGFILISCENSSNKNFQFDVDSNQEDGKVYTPEQIKDLKSASKVVYTLPSPNEMAQILYETKSIYDLSILNKVKNVNFYLTDLHKSLNLGVYFADLSFTSMFDFPQQAMKFMGAAQHLAEELNVADVFTPEMTSKLEDNLGNKDTLIQIVADAYLDTDKFLQDNNRPSTAKSVLAGAWIEGLYIACNLKLNKNNNDVIKQKIAEQKSAVGNLIDLLKELKDNNLKDLIKDLEKLNLQEIRQTGTSQMQKNITYIQQVKKLLSLIKKKIGEINVLFEKDKDKISKFDKIYSDKLLNLFGKTNKLITDSLIEQEETNNSLVLINEEIGICKFEWATLYNKIKGYSKYTSQAQVIGGLITNSKNIDPLLLNIYPKKVFYDKMKYKL